MNHLIAILDEALSANLGKRQWAAFVAVLRQTLGYRKLSDDLSSRRLEQLTRIQRNHIWQAKNELVALGLLLSEPGTFGEILSFAVLQGTNQPDGVAASTNGVVFSLAAVDAAKTESLLSPGCESADCAIPSEKTPSVCGSDAPDSGDDGSQIRPEPRPNWDTTVSNLTESNPTLRCNSVDAEPVVSAGVSTHLVSFAGESVAGLEWPQGLAADMRRDAAGLLCGLQVQTAQTVLDVLAMGLDAGSVRKPLAYLRALVRSSHNGRLCASEAQAWRRQRAQVQQKQAGLAQREQQAEWQWVTQMADLQGLPVELVAAQLGVKKRSPHESVGGCKATAEDTPDPQWRQATRDSPSVGRRVSGSVAA